MFVFIFISKHGSFCIPGSVDAVLGGDYTVLCLRKCILIIPQRLTKCSKPS